LIDVTAGCLNDHALREFIYNFRKGGRPVNHDIEKALRRSFLHAIQNIVSDCHEKRMGESPREFIVVAGGRSYPISLARRHFRNIADIIRGMGDIVGSAKIPAGLVTVAPVYPPAYKDELEWLDRKRNQLAREMKRNRKGKSDDLFGSFEEIETLLLPTGPSAVKRIQALKEKVIAEVLKENPMSECYGEKVREELFDLIRAHFVWEIKYNPVIFHIFMAHSAVQTSSESEDSRRSLAEISSELKDLKQSLADISSELKDLKQSSRVSEAVTEVELDVDVEDLSDPHLKEAVRHLGKLGNVTLKIQWLEAGSVTATLEGSREGIERIRKLFKSGELTEILGIPVKDVRVRLPFVSYRERLVNMGQWLQKHFNEATEAGWQTLEDIFGKKALAAAFMDTPAVRRAKQVEIELGQRVAVVAEVTRKENGKVDIFLRIYPDADADPDADAPSLPDGLRLIILSETGEILTDVIAPRGADCIEQEFTDYESEEKFGFMLELEDVRVMEYFEV